MVVFPELYIDRHANNSGLRSCTIYTYICLTQSEQKSQYCPVIILREENLIAFVAY